MDSRNEWERCLWYLLSMFLQFERFYIGLEALYTRSQHNKHSKLNGAPEGMGLDQEVLFINVFRRKVTF